MLMFILSILIRYLQVRYADVDGRELINYGHAVLETFAAFGERGAEEPSEERRETRGYWTLHEMAMRQREAEQQ